MHQHESVRAVRDERQPGDGLRKPPLYLGIAHPRKLGAGNLGDEHVIHLIVRHNVEFVVEDHRTASAEVDYVLCRVLDRIVLDVRGGPRLDGVLIQEIEVPPEAHDLPKSVRAVGRTHPERPQHVLCRDGVFGIGGVAVVGSEHGVRESVIRQSAVIGNHVAGRAEELAGVGGAYPHGVLFALHAHKPVVEPQDGIDVRHVREIVPYSEVVVPGMILSADVCVNVYVRLYGGEAVSVVVGGLVLAQRFLRGGELSR